jgi:broad specificity phosphatase PhoE
LLKGVFVDEICFLVRHSSYDYDAAQRLTAEGVRQSEAARDELMARQLGGKAYLLSSDAPRAIQTASIIGGGLEVPVLPSKIIRRGSLKPTAVGKLEEFLAQLLITMRVRMMLNMAEFTKHQQN